MKYNFLTTINKVLGRFFHGPGSGFFRIGSGSLSDPDPDSEKISLIRIRKKTRIRNTAEYGSGSTTLTKRVADPRLEIQYFAKFEGSK